MTRPSIKLLVKSAYRDFSKKETCIADLLLDNPKKVSRMTINELASELGVAPSTVFQFTRKLGFSGFRDFHNTLLTEEFDPEVSIHENIQPNDNALNVAQKVFSSSITSLQDTCSLLSEADLEHAGKLILTAKTVAFFGIGGSNVVAFDAYHKFLRAPINAQYATDAHIQLMQASLLQKDDCAIVTTHSGLTKEALAIARVAREAGAHVIALTSYPSPQLAELSDIVFVSASEETGYRSESLSSRIAQLAIVDSLFTLVMFRSEGKARESLRRIREVISPTKEEAL